MKKIIFAHILCCLCLAAHAQHEFSIYGGGGMEADGYSWHSGLGYRYFFAPWIGIGTGAEMAYVDRDFSSSSNEIDPQYGDTPKGRYELRIKTEGQIYMLQVPLMLQLNMESFYIKASGKAGFPISGENTVKKSGYYGYENYEYAKQERMGFGAFKEKAETAFFGSLEAGYKWKLAKDVFLYTGAYFDYGAYTIAGGKIALAFGDDGREARRLAAEQAAAEEAARKAAEEEALRKAAEEEAARKAAEEAARKAAEEEAARKAAEEAARKAAEEEAARKAAEDKARLEKELEEQKMMYIDAMRNALSTVHQTSTGRFSISQTELNDIQRQDLDQKITLLQNYPDFRFYIYGHTCDLGGPEANERLGMERAKNARDYMVSKGIEESRILGIGSKLDTEPLIPNTSEENRAMNRRVEIVIEKTAMEEE